LRIVEYTRKVYLYLLEATLRITNTAKTKTPFAGKHGHDSTDTTLPYTKATGADLEARVEKLAWE
jgi:hypothetical protein